MFLGYITNSMEQSPSWEASRSSASKEIPPVLWKPKVHYRTHKSRHLSLSGYIMLQLFYGYSIWYYVHVMLFPMTHFLYFYIITFQIRLHAQCPVWLFYVVSWCRAFQVCFQLFSELYWDGYYYYYYYYYYLYLNYIFSRCECCDRVSTCTFLKLILTIHVIYIVLPVVGQHL
jgi:hypothetical protein